jgi:hypothetical protein
MLRSYGKDEIASLHGSVFSQDQLYLHKAFGSLLAMGFARSVVQFT